MSSMVPICLRDPFWDDPHFMSSRRDFEETRRRMMREAKDFWTRVDDDSAAMDSSLLMMAPDRDNDWATNPAISMPRWFMPARRDPEMLRGTTGGGWLSRDNQVLRVINDENKFEITLDVHNYRPEELKVRTQPDKSIVIEGKHEERTSADTGSPTSTTRSSATKRSPGLSSSISGLGSSSSATSADRNNYNAVLQQFSRQFSLPPGCDPLRVVSNLSRDGVLVITAPKKIAAKSLDSRSVPIKH